MSSKEKSNKVDENNNDTEDRLSRALFYRVLILIFNMLVKWLDPNIPPASFGAVRRTTSVVACYPLPYVELEDNIRIQIRRTKGRLKINAKKRQRCAARYSLSSVSRSLGKGSKMRRFTARLNVDDAVRTVTTRTWPSSPGCTSTTRASGHLLGGVVSLRSTHKRPTLTAASDLHHFGR